MSKTSSTSSGETKQDDTPLHYSGAKLIPSATTKEELITTDLVRWTTIFSYLHFNEYERLSVRNLCRLFHTVLPGPTCDGVYTMYPHPNHASLDSLMNCLNEMARVENSDSSDDEEEKQRKQQRNQDKVAKNVQLPEHLFLANGVHVIDGRCVNITIPISIIGESREHCIVMGGLYMDGNEVNVSNLTLRDSKENGVYGNGASFHLNNVSVENSEEHGVSVSHTKRNTMKNCNVSHSKNSGLYVYDSGLMTIDGNGTTIHHNGTRGEIHWTAFADLRDSDYGLKACDSSSIHLASSLTIEMISKNNGGGGNHGGPGTISIVDNEGTIIETIQEATLESGNDY